MRVGERYRERVRKAIRGEKRMWKCIYVYNMYVYNASLCAYEKAEEKVLKRSFVVVL